ncbi:ATP-binding protein [Streptomyces sp. NPDC016845]|uniref:ATP-binding protein n=1 Tax=Streptomyces sp. NPDC016845 TaxID=3364972 RepID=UPI0037AD37EF
MDPNNLGPDNFGQDQRDDTPAGGRRPPRDQFTPDFGQPSPALARTVQLVSGEYLLTVNPVDGSEIEICPPPRRPARPVKYDATERAELVRATRPPLPPGPALPRLPLLERQEERERLVRLLARGRSVRLTGPSGAGRTALLDQVAEDCADIAPDGVVRLSGHRRTATDLLHDLFAAVYNAQLHRPDRALLLELVHEIGAVVVLDDLEFGGAALDELLEATPECAFLLSTTPDVAAPAADSLVEEVFLGGLSRGAGLELLERAVGRVLTDDEAQWAGDLWFESEGLPLRFAQAGALLRQRDLLRADPDGFDAFGLGEDTDADPADPPLLDTSYAIEDGPDVPLPSLADGAAPAALLASRMSASARATLRFAVALGGEVPHQAHLPALVGDTHADAALAELVSCALVTSVGGRYRLASGVQVQLEAVGFGEETSEYAHTAARHYAWWAAHPSVGPERVAAEADAVLAALSVLVPGTTPPGEDEASPAVELARAAAPAFAAGFAWSSWERALRSGQEASRLSGEVPEEAYFHHELGILALLGGNLDRARAELEASIGLRGALADKRGTIAGRRALALVADRSGGVLPGGRTAAGEEVPEAMYEESASPPGGVPAAYPFPVPVPEPVTVATRKVPPVPAPVPAPTVVGGKAPTRRSIVGGTRRNLVAAGAGALLVAVLGTVVTLGATSGNEDSPSDKVGTNPSATAGENSGDLGADEAPRGGGTTSGPASSTPSDPGADGIPGTADDPGPTTSATRNAPSSSPTASATPDDPETSPSKPPSKSPSKSPSKTPPPSSPDPTTSEPDPDPSTSEPDPGPTTTPPEPPGTTTNSAPLTSSAAGSSAP